MSQENVDLVQRSLDHYDETGEFLWDLIDPGVIWIVDPPAFLAGTYRGHEGIRALLRGITEVFEEVRLEVDELIDAGDSVVILGRFRVRGRGSGATGKQQIAIVSRLRDGRLVAYHSYFGREEALEAVGLRE
jgi:uncharacterized protein